MVDLKEAFDWIARDTPELGDIAERAIEQSRSRRQIRRWVVPGAGVAAVASTLALVLGFSLLHKEGVELNYRSPRPAGGGTWTIGLSEKIPKPLPKRPIGAVDLAYQLGCGQSEERATQKVSKEQAACRQWRLWREGGESWRITDVASWEDDISFGSPPVLLSPQGDRIAYVRASDKATVVLNLVTGDVHKVVKGGAILPWAWSPNGRWLALATTLNQGGSPSPRDAKPRVVDTKTWKVTALPQAGWILGVPNAGEPVPVRDHERFGLTKLWKLDGTPVHQVKVPRSISEGFEGIVSPDGRRLVGNAAGWSSDFLVYDIKTGKITGRHPTSKMPAGTVERGETGEIGASESMGWFDENTVLAKDLTDFAETSHIYGIDVRTGKVRTLIRFLGASPFGTPSLASARR